MYVLLRFSEFKNRYVKKTMAIIETANFSAFGDRLTAIDR